MSATSSYPASYGDPAAVYHHHQYFPPAPIDAFPSPHPPASGSSSSWTYPADMPPNEYSPPPSAASHSYLPPPSDYNVEMQSYTPLATAPWQLQHQLQQPLQQVGSSAAASNELAKPPKRGANKKERRRTMSINNAFAELRECIPNVPADTKLSKIKTLRLATSYIAYLSDILQCDDEAVPEFKAEIKKTDRNDERRKRELAMILEQEQKSHGRTGWPQHVWALELKQ